MGLAKLSMLSPTLWHVAHIEIGRAGQIRAGVSSLSAEEQKHLPFMDNPFCGGEITSWGSSPWHHMV